MPLRERDTSTVQTAADTSLSSPRCANPNTRRGYTGVLNRLLTGLGASRPLAEVSGEELAGLMEQLWAVHSDRQDRRRQGKLWPGGRIQGHAGRAVGRAHGAPKGRDGAVEAIRR
jgi:hypothetical protein